MGVVLKALIPLIAIFLGTLYQNIPLLHVTHMSIFHGKVEGINDKQCSVVPDVEACEKIVLHQPSGLLYMACSSAQSRWAWLPYSLHFRRDPTLPKDYIAFYNPDSDKVQKLTFKNLYEGFEYHAHGMDVVPSRTDPNVLFVYVVNHRPQSGKKAGKEATLGADSVIELFKTTVGDNTLTHVKTFWDPSVIVTPNDVTGSPDGDSFFFTNDMPDKTDALSRFLTMALGLYKTSVGYCHIEEGCQYAAKELRGANGIVRLNDETIWVMSLFDGKINVYTRQADNTLSQIEQIEVGYPLDNLVKDGEGNVYGASGYHLLQMVAHLKDPFSPKNKVPPVVRKISLNTGEGAFYGEKYKVETVFRENGTLLSFPTSGVVDPEKRRVYVSALYGKVGNCKI